MNDPEPLDQAAPGAPPELHFDWSPRPKFQDRRWLNALLLLLTFVTTTFWGGVYYEGFVSDLGRQSALASVASLFAHGLWYSLTILTFLGCHEFGHYLACRYYNVDASLPFFIPMPFLLTGTMGAVIRIREPIPTKRMLFDIGIAGPIAGFVVAIPVLIAGLAMSHVVQLPQEPGGLWLGEPLLLKAMSFLIWGPMPEGYTLNLHPMGFAAWFGLLATSFNLLPVGQLDGGHIAYAVFGRRSSAITLATLGLTLALGLLSTSWLFWTFVMTMMLWRFGRHHPPTFDEHDSLDISRKRLAVFALLMLIVCFTPVPVETLDVITR